MNALFSILDHVPREKRVVRRPSDGAVMPDTSKPVTIDGVEYESMAAATKALACSYSKVYRLIGERWRYEKRKAKA